ncbi:hypothetical protein Rsub_02041 [Raphidocelis subcapitata]|uniref:START domain-containing protein n=1 Tax=Raphidocelis subcapitata TaxID=307507 RepID=A0A2V0NQB2_9CHLO|nr:hypothetical protein Rsub_02041 [Raphidocelis subcapitata]|eukprot:GBF89469.1 hypothetical protein Rsub_02041 [Raphidocelis subcapitata]
MAAVPDDEAFLASQPLTNGDRRALRTLLNGPRGSGGAGAQGAAAATRLMAHGITIKRAAQQGPRRIYRYYGSGCVDASAQLVFDALSNTGLVPQWDLLFKGAEYIAYERAGAVETARLRVVYGLPGVSRLVRDREFVLRALRVALPSGACVLCCRSVEPAAGDPAAGPMTIQGWMAASGYVVLPCDDSSCGVNMSLQVDPRGWIPSPIVNLSLEAIPLNLARLRGVLARLPPDEAGQLGEPHAQQTRLAKPAAGGDDDGAAASGGATSSASEGGGGSEWAPAREGWEDGEGESHKRARLEA